MVWMTSRPLLQDIRAITCLCNPSLAADDFPRCLPLALHLDLVSKPLCSQHHKTLHQNR
jgi:hypothetical protein